MKSHACGPSRDLRAPGFRGTVSVLPPGSAEVASVLEHTQT